MRVRLILPCLLLAVSPCLASDKPIRLPVAPVVPQPMPPAPVAVNALGLDQLYVIDSDVPLLVLSSPVGLVKVVEDAGPLKIRGRFVDGTGTETRTYKGKHVFVIEAAGTGRVELLIVPVGAAKEADVLRVTLDVDAQNPIPPPKPPEPKPPEPKPPEPVKSFRVLFVYESADKLTQAQHSTIYAKPVSDYLDAKATKEGAFPGWLRLDKDANGDNLPPEMKAMWGKVKPELTGLPCIAVAVNKNVEIVPLPASPEELVALLKKYAEGK